MHTYWLLLPAEILHLIFTNINKIIVSLAVQELHDWLQDVVSILRHAAGVSYI